MAEEGFRLSVKESHLNKIQNVAVKAQLGAQIEEEMQCAVLGACAQVCSIWPEDPEMAVLELIGGLKQRHTATNESRPKQKQAFALAIHHAETILADLANKSYGSLNYWQFPKC